MLNHPVPFRRCDYSRWKDRMRNVGTSTSNLSDYQKIVCDFRLLSGSVEYYSILPGVLMHSGSGINFIIHVIDCWRIVNYDTEKGTTQFGLRVESISCRLGSICRPFLNFVTLSRETRDKQDRNEPIFSTPNLDPLLNKTDPVYDRFLKKIYLDVTSK